MLVLGLLLLLLAAALLIGFLTSGTQKVEFKSALLEINLDALTIYLLGALTLLLLVAGLVLVLGGVRRAGRRRKERKELNRLSAKVEKQEADRTEGAGEPSAKERAEGSSTAPADGPTTTSGSTTEGSGSNRS
jgi:hypothetical protein